MLSYGVRLDGSPGRSALLRTGAEQLRERIPRRHVEFLQSLELSFESGDYLFVHAGVNPACPLDQQIADDLLWIREPF